MSQHMADVAAEAVVMNGFAQQCLIVNKDVRRINAVTKPDGTPPDLERKADICVYEVSFEIHGLGDWNFGHSKALATACSGLRTSEYCQTH